MSILFYLVRHGETADNAARIFQGQGGSGLSLSGRAQAEHLADRMRRLSPTRLVTSDLERAVETAQIVANACALEVELDPDLREVDLGAWTGKSHEEVATLYPEEWAAWSAGMDARRGGGETYAELALRVSRALDRLASTGDDEARIAVVSHGGAIKSWVARILGVSASGRLAFAGLDNTALAIVERDARGRYRLRSWNDRAHLDRLPIDRE